jgi:hypothetical protein
VPLFPVIKIGYHFMTSNSKNQQNKLTSTKNTNKNLTCNIVNITDYIANDISFKLEQAKEKLPADKKLTHLARIFHEIGGDKTPVMVL